MHLHNGVAKDVGGAALCSEPITFYEDCRYQSVLEKMRVVDGATVHKLKSKVKGVIVPDGCKAVLYSKSSLDFTSKHPSHAMSILGPDKACLVGHLDAVAVEVSHNVDIFKLFNKVEASEKLAEVGEKRAEASEKRASKFEAELQSIETKISHGALRGPTGAPGKDGVDGAPGKRGERGLTGEKGEKGTDGVGLHLKSFKLGVTYNKGDYVFEDSSKGDHHSMFIAKHSFKAKQRPKNDHPNWSEFEAPQGEKGSNGEPGKEGKEGAKGKDGAKGSKGKDGVDGAPGKPGSNGKDGVDGAPGKRGERGLTGEKGEKGTDGVGLHLKSFKLGVTYNKGDYVFEDSSKGDHHSMFIAKHSFKAKQRPKNDHPNWSEFEAPQGEKGSNGKEGKEGPKGKDGTNGKDGVDGAPGKRGEPGSNGKDGVDGAPGKRGERGLTGEKGEKGPAGPKGKDAPKPSPAPAPAPQPSGIRVTEASYGYYNCGRRGSSQTNNLARACNGKDSCSYRVNHGSIGDPAGGCPKQYHYKWCCGSKCHEGKLGSEASGKTLRMSCHHAPAPQARGIQITSASYGFHNCGRRGSHQKSNLAAACNGKSSCSYRINHNSIGDPAGGCPKQYHYAWCCGSKCQKGVAGAEASGKTISLHC